MRASEEILAPLAAATGGAVLWLTESGLPELRPVQRDRDYVGEAGITGRPWIGLRRNGDFVVTGLTLTPLLPGILVLLLAIGGLMLAWRREGT